MNDIKGIIEDVEKSSLVSNNVIKKVIKIIGQEEWNNINDEELDICTTTGELLITLQGIAELEQENAELKDKLEVVISVGNTCLNDMNKELNKAKKLLTKWVELFRPKGGNIPPTPIQVETEQFLSRGKK